MPDSSGSRGWVVKFGPLVGLCGLTLANPHGFSYYLLALIFLFPAIPLLAASRRSRERAVLLEESTISSTLLFLLSLGLFAAVIACVGYGLDAVELS